MFKDLFSKKPSSITLSKVLELKDTIQEKLKSNHNILKLENSVFQGQKRNYDLKKVVKESEILQDKLIQLKLLVQQANLKIVEGEKYPISHYVYLLSEKKTAVSNLMSTLKVTFEGTTKNEVTNEMVTYAKPTYSRREIEEWVNTLKKSCREIENKLTDLNNSIIVELPFKPNLK